MQCRPILVDDTLRELTCHGTPEFPLSMDRQAVADPSHGSVRHWHPEVQINLVTAGEILFRAGDAEVRLRAGEGFFVNSGVLHEAVPAEHDNGVYICVNFLPTVLFGAADSALRRDYMEPLLSCEALSGLPLRNDVPWQREVCALLRQLGDVEEAAAYGYEIQLVALLCQIWRLLVVYNREEIECSAALSFNDRQRVRTIQTYIHRHCMEHVTLSDMARAGHVSQGECCRAFQRVLGVTPGQYLTHCRMAQCAQLLSSTGRGVAEIARQAGYGTPSYFTERFRREMGCTPLAYRRRHRRPPEEKLSGS